MPPLKVHGYLQKERKGLRDSGTPWPGALQSPGPREKTVPVEREGYAILCAGCSLRITDFESVMEVEGGHELTFVNPSGTAFRIGCFSSAAGCRVEGVPTLEFTWFPGFGWSFALCRNCGIHLGWHYESPREAGFYGLILARLVWAKAG